MIQKYIDIINKAKNWKELKQSYILFKQAFLDNIINAEEYAELRKVWYNKFEDMPV